MSKQVLYLGDTEPTEEQLTRLRLKYSYDVSVYWIPVRSIMNISQVETTEGLGYYRMGDLVIPLPDGTEFIN